TNKEMKSVITMFVMQYLLANSTDSDEITLCYRT
uniref:Uncharacterized protein n=1 Tax=Amphimedon queenslandica TaxID=400682 RepID=A0A1X7UWZ4_AMPQE